MKFLNSNKVLCLSPHPDDVEYSMSLTIEKHRDTKFHIYTFGWGGEGDASNGPNRIEECDIFWVGTKNVTIFNEYKSIVSNTEPKWVSIIEDLIAAHQYDMICIPSLSDTHPDHRYINSIAIQACRNHGITIIEYKSPSCLQEWKPNLYMKMTEDLVKVKADMLNIAFKTQADSFYFNEDTIKRFHTDFYSYKRGVEYAEMFNILQLYN
jgi:LmbE family N-acetylglucosaminyl deacetylase